MKHLGPDALVNGEWGEGHSKKILIQKRLPCKDNKNAGFDLTDKIIKEEKKFRITFT